jgi:hypothetical protein
MAGTGNAKQPEMCGISRKLRHGLSADAVAGRRCQFQQSRRRVECRHQYGRRQQEERHLDLVYSNQGFYWDWQGIFIGAANFNNMYTPTTQNYFSVGNWWLINSTIGMQFNKQFRAQLIVDNVFNKEPPFPALAGTGGNFVGATTTYFSGILGRALQSSFDYKFY